jgi:2'-5' RNA ligase
MKLDKPTYLIAELKGEIEDYVYGLRSKFNPERTSWPTDITVAGSSGIGTISEGQELEIIVSEIAGVLSSFQFEDVAFDELDRFPNTGIYVLKPIRDKFDALHEAIKATKVSFNESPWPYNPHCTLCAKRDNTEELDSAFSGASFPKSARIKCFSLYQPEANGGSRIHKF